MPLIISAAFHYHLNLKHTAVNTKIYSLWIQFLFSSSTWHKQFYGFILRNGEQSWLFWTVRKKGQAWNIEVDGNIKAMDSSKKITIRVDDFNRTLNNSSTHCVSNIFTTKVFRRVRSVTYTAEGLYVKVVLKWKNQHWVESNCMWNG